MNLSDISKLPPAMQRAALADQARATAARERIMAQAKINPEWKALETSGKPYAEMQRDGSWRSVPVESPKNTVSAQMQAILPQCPGVKVKHPRVPETVIQQEIVKWFDVHACDWGLEPELLMAFPLQGKRTKKSGGRLKAEGMRKGTLDMLLAVPRGDCCSLWIENKSSTGKLSEAQKLMLKRLTNAGAVTVVCRSAAEAIAAITAYLNLSTPSKP